MNESALTICVVEDVSEGAVFVACIPKDHRALLKKLGGRKRLIGRDWKIRYSSDQHLAQILSALRDDGGFAFLGTPGGISPAGLWEYLRDKGLLRGPFTEITWRGPGDPILIHHKG